MQAALSRNSARRVQMWADTVGRHVPRANCGGSVDSVFENACNVLLESGRLVTVLASRAGNVAHGVRLSSDLRFDHCLRQGMPVQVAGDRIDIGGGAVTVMLSGARAWRAGLRPGRCAWRPRSSVAARRVRELLGPEAAKRGSEFLARVLRLPGAASPLAARISAVLPALALAARERDGDSALRRVAHLIGLGPGLTPAGDDFVIGWLAGLTLWACTPEHLAFLQDMSRGIAQLATETTSVSRAHLQDACAGEFSERLAGMCVAIGEGFSGQALAARVSAQAGVGASSGADAAAGLLFALFECGPAANFT